MRQSVMNKQKNAFMKDRYFHNDNEVYDSNISRNINKIKLFYNSLFEDKILNGKLLGGTLGAYYYEGEGTKIWEKITKNPKYYASRDSAKLANDLAHKALSEAKGKNTELYLFGASYQETIAFSKAVPDCSKIVLVDICSEYAEKQVQLFRKVLGKTNIYFEIFDFQTELNLLNKPICHRTIIIPSSNIGNLPVYYDESPRNNSTLISYIIQLLKKCNLLVIGYDTQLNENKLKAAYSGYIHDKFVLSTFSRISEEFGLNLDVNKLKREPVFISKPQLLAHKVTVNAPQVISINQEDIELKTGQSIYPGHSIKFKARPNEYSKENDLEILVSKAGGKACSPPIMQQNNSIALQSFSSDQLWEI